MRYLNKRFPKTLVTAALAALISLAACGQKEKTSEDAGAAAGGKDSVSILLIGRDSVSAFDLLKEGHEVDYSETAQGVFVRKIDEYEGGAEAFWLYSVNDSFPSKASDLYLTSDGDTVIWHFRKIAP
jgi:hypothetical protein